MAKLLITNCSQDPGVGGVYLLDTAAGEHRQVHDVPSRGIAETPDGYYVVGNKGAVHHLDPRTWKSTPRADLKLDGSHDLRFLNGYFYLVASHGNLVVRLDSEFRELDRIQIVEDEGDVCHANCLLEVNGELLLSIFTLTPGRREEKRHGAAWRTDGKVLRLNWEGRPPYTVAFEPLSQPHSLVWRDGLLYCCESFASQVTALDLATGARQTLYQRFGFVRGLAFDGDTAYVGVSRVRVKIPLAQRIAGWFQMRNGVCELDARTWKLRRQFPLPGTETYEILVMEGGG